MSSGSGPLPPAARISLRLTTTVATSGAAAATAAFSWATSSAGTPPPMMMALGALRWLASTVALVPKPELGVVLRSPAQRAGSSATADVISTQPCTTWGPFVSWVVAKRKTVNGAEHTLKLGEELGANLRPDIGVVSEAADGDRHFGLCGKGE